MSESVKRLREDLTVMQEAAGLGPHFDRREVRNIGLASLFALPLILWGLFGSADSPYPELVIAITLLAIYTASSLTSARAYERRAQVPQLWREHRRSLMAVATLSIAALGYLLIALWGEISWSVAMATAIYFAGVATVALAVTDRNRLYLMGGAIPTLGYGAFFPLYDSRQLLLATAAWIALSCLATAALMRWELSRRSPVDGSD